MKKTLAFAFCLSVPCYPAYALHPLVSDDTALLGRDVRQVRTVFEHDVFRSGPDVYSNTLTGEISYGLFDSVDILASAPWQGWSSRGASGSGPGDVLLEAKFRTGKEAGWDLALKPGFSLPAGDEAKSLGAGKGNVWLYGIAGRSSGPWKFFLNGGYLLNRNSVDARENILKASAAAVYALLPGLAVTGELAAATNTDKASSSHPVSSVLGFVWSPSASFDLDAGLRLGLTRPAADLGLLAGFVLRL